MWHVNTELNTPNPRIDDENGRGVAHVIQRDPHPSIGQGVTIEEAMRRAQLMAAAPDLLEACIAAAEYDALLDDFTLAALRQAIARATGSGDERPHP